jgi:hypothetical protein
LIIIQWVWVILGRVRIDHDDTDLDMGMDKHGFAHTLPSGRYNIMYLAYNPLMQDTEFKLLHLRSYQCPFDIKLIDVQWPEAWE